MGNIVVLFCVVIITSNLDDEVGNCSFTPADGATANDTHARIFTTLECARDIISHQKSLHQKFLRQKLDDDEHNEKEITNIKLLDAAFVNYFQPVIVSIFIAPDDNIVSGGGSGGQPDDAVIIHTFSTALASDNILQISLHQKIKDKLHENDYYIVKEADNIPQLAAFACLNSHVHLIFEFDDGDLTPSLVAITVIHFAACLLLPTLSFPAPYGIPDGNIVLGGGSGGAVVIRGVFQPLNLSLYLFILLLPVHCCSSEIHSVLSLFIQLYLFQNMLCVMIIINDCYAYRGVNKLLGLLHILFILGTVTIYFISIVCFVVLLVYKYFTNDNTLIKKRGLKVPHNLFCFSISYIYTNVARCSGNILYGFIILSIIFVLFTWSLWLVGSFYPNG